MPGEQDDEVKFVSPCSSYAPTTQEAAQRPGGVRAQTLWDCRWFGPRSAPEGPHSPLPSCRVGHERPIPRRISDRQLPGEMTRKDTETETLSQLSLDLTHTLTLPKGSQGADVAQMPGNSAKCLRAALPSP